MNAVQEYRRTFNKTLRCGIMLKKKLLRQLDDILSPFLEENATPTQEDLIQAVGNPRQLAETMLHEQPGEVLDYDRRSRIFRWIAIFVLVSALVGFIVYLITPQEINLTIEETVVVYEEYEEKER